MKTKEEVLKKLNNFRDEINFEFSMLGFISIINPRDKYYNYDYTEFKFPSNTYYDREYKVLIVYQSSQADFNINGKLGLCWIELIDISGAVKKDLEIMKSIFNKVEENLLKIGIPFDNDYKFNQKWKYRKNKQNRAKYDLDNLERELLEVIEE